MTKEYGGTAASRTPAPDQTLWPRMYRDHSAWWATLVAVLFCLTCLRNTFAVQFPYLFGEDVSWTSKILEDGYFRAAIYARADFPAFLQVGLLQASLFLTKLLFGDDIAPLPLSIWVMANAFVTLVALSPMLIPRAMLGTGYRALMCVMLALMPVGYYYDGIYGRILNLQWFLPVVMQFILVRLSSDDDLRTAFRVALLASALLLMLSFPVCIIQFAAFVAFRAFLARSNLRGAVTGLAVNGALVLLAVSQVRPAAGVKSTAFPAIVNPAGVVETFVARSFLYPWTAAFYQHFNDPRALVAGGAFAAIIVALMLHQTADPRHRLGRNILLANTVLVTVVTLLTRRGVSAFYGSYNVRFPADQYFLATNMMVVTAVIMLASGLRTRPPKLAATGLLVLVPLSWVATQTVPERHGENIAEHGTFIDAICAVNRQRSKVPSDANGMVAVPSYPFAKDNRWSFSMPRKTFAVTSGKHCRPVLPIDVYQDPETGKAHESYPRQETGLALDDAHRLSDDRTPVAHARR